MANPVYMGNGGLASNATANDSLVVTLPSGIAANDILIANIMLTDNASSNTPVGWNIIHKMDNGGSTTFCYTSYWRRAESAESGTVTFVPVGAWTGLYMGIIYRFTGCVTTGTPYESLLGLSTAPTTGATKVVSPTAPTGAQRLGLVLGICEDDTITSIAGTGWSQASLLQTLTGTDGGMALATKSLNSDDLIGDVTLTMNNAFDFASVVSLMLIPAVIDSGNIIKINIGDVWKDSVGMKINVGDVWKTVVSVKINVGDVWKDVT